MPLGPTTPRLSTSLAVLTAVGRHAWCLSGFNRNILRVHAPTNRHVRRIPQPTTTALALNYCAAGAGANQARCAAGAIDSSSGSGQWDSRDNRRCYTGATRTTPVGDGNVSQQDLSLSRYICCPQSTASAPTAAAPAAAGLI